MRIVVPFGFYGAGNIGDEATLHGFARLLAYYGKPAHVSVSSRNPAHTARIEPAFRYFHSHERDPRRWIAKLRGAVHAMVGGTPIMDVEGEWPLSELTPLVRAVDRWKTPLAFVGIGTEPLQRQESRLLVAREIAPRVRHWSVRCDRDRQRLIEYGVAPEAVTVAADMAWLIEAADLEGGREHLARWGADPRRPLFAVNLVNENALFDRQPHIVSELASALDEFAARTGGQVVFLSNEVREGAGFDKAAASRVIAAMKRSTQAVLGPNEYLAPREMMSVIGCCSLAMSMRYHFCLFSALQGVPFIAIERSGKVADLCWDLNWTGRISLSQIEAAAILDHWNRLMAAGAAVAEQLKQGVEVMRQRARRNTIPLDALVAAGQPADLSLLVRRIRDAMISSRS